MRRALNLTLIHLIRFPLNHSHLVLTRQSHSEGKPMTPPETCKKAWSEPVALNSAENFSLHYRIFCTFIIWSHVLRQPRFWSSPAGLRCDRTRQGCRQEFAKNTCQKTDKDNGHYFSLLTISKTVHKCSEGIYLILKCSRSTFVEQLWEFFSSRSGTFGPLLLFLLLLLFFFLSGIALSFLDPSLYPLTWIAQIDVGQLMGYGPLILFCLCSFRLGNHASTFSANVGPLDPFEWRVENYE